MYGYHAKRSESGPSSIYGLPLDPTSPDRTLTLRDDRLDFPGLLDTAAACRRGGARLRLVDQGRLPVSELEWLGEAGAAVVFLRQGPRRRRRAGPHPQGHAPRRRRDRVLP